MSAHDSPSGLSSQPVELVFICTGNRARSPFAAELAKRDWGTADVAVTSRGLLDLEGVTALPEAIWAAQGFGIDLSAHRARPLREGELEGADLVVGFERQHVASAVVLGGAAKERTFLIHELAELVGPRPWRPGDGPPAFADAIRRAHEERFDLVLGTRGVADPVGTPKETFVATFEQIDRMLAAIGVGLFALEYR